MAWQEEGAESSVILYSSVLFCNSKFLLAFGVDSMLLEFLFSSVYRSSGLTLCCIAKHCLTSILSIPEGRFAIIF